MDDESLWAAFTGCTLTHGQWSHESHLRTAWLFLQRFSLDEAHIRMRAGIIRLNERHGLVETSERGYFETLTRVWLVLVLDAQLRSPALHSRDLLERGPELLVRSLPLRYYSAALLKTARARAVFVAPDVAPLPEVP